MKFQGAGKLYWAVRDGNGAPGAFIYGGCADALNIGLAVDSFEHIERCSGNNGVDFRGEKKLSGTVSFTLTDFKADNEIIATRGKKKAALVAPVAVTNEEFPTVADGQSVQLGGADPHDTITTLVITDSSSSPATLTLGTDYTLDAEYGWVTFLDVSGLVQPFTADYSYQNKQYVAFFGGTASEYWLRFNYLNVANSKAKGIVDVYDVRLDPASQLELINPEIQTKQISGSVLSDPDKSDTGDLGQFGRITVAA